jgi:6-phosphogluconolactonase (cycloisomerase 2 family)
MKLKKTISILCSIATGVSLACSLPDIYDGLTDHALTIAYVSHDYNLGTSIQAYAVSNATGGFVKLIGAYDTGAVATTLWISVHPTKRFLFSANDNGTVSAFSINQETGELSLIATPYPAAGVTCCLAIHPSGKYLYALNQNSPLPGSITAFSIDQNSGALTALTTGPFSTGLSPTYGMIDSTGNHLYVTNYDDQTMSEYTINNTTGALTAMPLSPVLIGYKTPPPPTTLDGKNPGSFTINPAGTLLFATFQTGHIYYFPMTSGNISNSFTGQIQLSGSVLNHIIINRSGNYIYFVDANFNYINSYSVNSAGLDTSIGFWSTGSNPQRITFGPDEKYIYAANLGGGGPVGSVSVFSVNSSTGDLSEVNGSPFATNSANRSIAVVKLY